MADTKKSALPAGVMSAASIFDFVEGGANVRGSGSDLAQFVQGQMAFMKRYRVEAVTGAAALAISGGLSSGNTSQSGTMSGRTIDDASAMNRMSRTGLTAAAAAATSVIHRMTISPTMRTMGFYFAAKFGIVTLPADGKLFVGLSSLVGASGLSPSYDPVSAGGPSIALTKATGDTNLVLRWSDSSGVTTSSFLDLGANFPATSGAVYQVEFLALPGGNITYKISRVDVAQTAAGTITTNLPNNTWGLAPAMWLATVTSSALDLAIGFYDLRTVA